MSDCPYGDKTCPCQDGDACHYEWAMGTRPMPHPMHARRRAKGECYFCDAHGDEPMMPRHDASPNCESGKRPHCTCDTCF